MLLSLRALSVTKKMRHSASQHSASSVAVLSFVKLNVAFLIVMLKVVMVGVILLSDVAPLVWLKKAYLLDIGHGSLTEGEAQYG